MDKADIAQIEHDRAMALFEKGRRQAPCLPSRVECLYCENRIPPARRDNLPGVQTCVECQSLIERGVAL